MYFGRGFLQINTDNLTCQNPCESVLISVLLFLKSYPKSTISQDCITEDAESFVSSAPL
jgi:hypothetical protein